MKSTQRVFAVFVLIVAFTARGGEVPLSRGEVPTLAGFTPDGKPAVYNPQDLWNAINGAAEIHMDYGFKELLVQKYKKGTRAVELEIFNQGRPMTAFGIFRRERPPKADVIFVGGEGAIQDPYTCMMWKGVFFVRARITSGEFDRALCEEILGAVSASLPGKNGLPSEIENLPKHNRFKDSVRFTPTGYLGILDLPDVVRATYKFEHFETAEIFRLLPRGPTQTELIWQRLLSKWKPVKGRHADALVREIPYKGPVIVVKTQSGIWGVVASGEIERALTWLLTSIKNRQRENGCSVR